MDICLCVMVGLFGWMVVGWVMGGWRCFCGCRGVCVSLGGFCLCEDIFYICNML